MPTLPNYPGVSQKRNESPGLPGSRFSKLPVIAGPVKLFCFPGFPDGSLKRFENQCTVKLSAKEGNGLYIIEVRIHPTFLETDFKI